MSYLIRLYKGRLNRQNYALCLITLVVLFFLFLVLPGIILGRDSFDSLNDPFILIPVSVLVLPLYVRRLHDLGFPGWIVLLSLLPMVPLLMGLALLIAKGKPTANEYGEPDRPRSFIAALLNLPEISQDEREVHKPSLVQRLKSAIPTPKLHNLRRLAPILIVILGIVIALAILSQSSKKIAAIEILLETNTSNYNKLESGDVSLLVEKPRSLGRLISKSKTGGDEDLKTSGEFLLITLSLLNKGRETTRLPLFISSYERTFGDISTHFDGVIKLTDQYGRTYEPVTSASEIHLGPGTVLLLGAYGDGGNIELKPNIPQKRGVLFEVSDDFRRGLLIIRQEMQETKGVQANKKCLDTSYELRNLEECIFSMSWTRLPSNPVRRVLLPTPLHAR